MKKLSFLLAIGYQLLAISYKTEAQTGIITTIAGNGTGGYNGDSIPATAAEVNQIFGIGIDSAGNIYFTDTGNNRIRKIATTGIVTTVAGNGIGGYSGDGGQATAAELFAPTGLAVDTLGNMYFADYGNSIIRMVNTSGIISTIAGIPLTSGFSGDGGQATAAELSQCYGVAIDKNLNVYFSDVINSDVRMINMSMGIITTVVGNRIAGFSGNGGQATDAELQSPFGIAVDKAGDIYVCDGDNNEVRVVNTSGVITAFAGTGGYGYNGSYGLSTTLELASPQGVAVSPAGNIYIADINYSLVWEVIPSTNQMYAIGGNHFSGFSGDGGPAISAELSCPFPVLVDKSNSVYIGDQCNYRFRKITAGCYDTAKATVLSSPHCNGNTNGEAVASYTSPFYPYIYSWSDGNTNQQDSGLAAGTYTVSITDVFGCTETSAVTITQPAALSVTADTISNVVCAGASNGSIYANVSGGTPPYTYLWSSGATGDTATGLSDGSYSVTVSDLCGNSATGAVSVNTDSLHIVIVANPDTLIVGDTSNIAVYCNIGPDTYVWQTGATNQNITVSPVDTTTYTVYVTTPCGTDSVSVTLYTIIATATNEIKGDPDSYRDEKVKVYPNPSNGNFTIQWSVVNGQSSDVRISILNELGQIVYSNNITGANGTLRTAGTYTEQLNLNNLASGIYTLRVESYDNSIIKKLVILKK